METAIMEMINKSKSEIENKANKIVEERFLSLMRRGVNGYDSFYCSGDDKALMNKVIEKLKEFGIKTKQETLRYGIGLHAILCDQ